MDAWLQRRFVQCEALVECACEAERRPRRPKPGRAPRRRGGRAGRGAAGGGAAGGAADGAKVALASLKPFDDADKTGGTGEAGGAGGAGEAGEADGADGAAGLRLCLEAVRVSYMIAVARHAVRPGGDTGWVAAAGTYAESLEAIAGQARACLARSGCDAGPPAEDPPPPEALGAPAPPVCPECGAPPAPGILEPPESADAADSGGSRIPSAEGGACATCGAAYAPDAPPEEAGGRALRAPRRARPAPAPGAPGAAAARSGRFNPARHIASWIDHTYALEPTEEICTEADPCGEQLLAALRAVVARDGLALRLLTVDDVRSMLKELRRTSLNKNVPLLLKLLTGVGPPAPAPGLRARVEGLLTRVVELGAHAWKASRVNRCYYPYYLYKILDSILAPGDREARRALYYIYIQGDDTLRKNDEEWRDVCAEIPELTWNSTDRGRGAEYFTPW